MDERTRQLLDRTFYFGVNTLKFLRKFPEDYIYKIPKLQVARSSVSIGANYEEVQGAVSKRDFTNKIGISYNEAKESHYWLRVLKQLYHDPKFKKDFDFFINEARELKSIFAAIKKSSKGRLKRFPYAILHFTLMNSSLYRATVMHNRIKPRSHRFHYNVFMFYIDLDEVDLITKKFWLVSRNKFNFFSFRDREHLQLPIDKPDVSKNTKQHIIDYLKQNNFNYVDQTIMLLTNLNILGYNFNPVSFYFVLDKNNIAECAIAEVSNTFREMKPYFLGQDTKSGDSFHLNTTKYFYVSPFIDHDTNFDFNVKAPDSKLNIRIDDYKEGHRFFISTLTGTKKPLSNTNLLLYSLRFPLLTLRIITLIHWQALLLFLKKLPYHKKSKNPDLQREVFRKYE